MVSFHTLAGNKLQAQHVLSSVEDCSDQLQGRLGFFTQQTQVHSFIQIHIGTYDMTDPVLNTENAEGRDTGSALRELSH